MPDSEIDFLFFAKQIQEINIANSFQSEMIIAQNWHWCLWFYICPNVISLCHHLVSMINVWTNVAFQCNFQIVFLRLPNEDHGSETRFGLKAWIFTYKLNFLLGPQDPRVSVKSFKRFLRWKKYWITKGSIQLILF